MTQAALSVLVPCRRWLSQGDVFTSVPIVRFNGLERPELTQGPALLVTHGCVIDKKTNSGASTLEYLNFLPVHSMGALQPHQAEELRRKHTEVRPFAVMYVGDIPSLGEGYVSLKRPYTLPASFLDPQLVPFTHEDTGDGDDLRPVPTRADTRIGMLDDEAVGRFQIKWMAHWTHLEPEA